MARSRESTADPLDLDYDAVIQVKDDTSIERDREYVPTPVYSCSTSLTCAVVGTQLKQFWGIALSKMYRTPAMATAVHHPLIKLTWIRARYSTMSSGKGSRTCLIEPGKQKKISCKKTPYGSIYRSLIIAAVRRPFWTVTGVIPNLLVAKNKPLPKPNFHTQ